MFDDRNITARATMISTITLLVALSGCRGNTVSPSVPSTPTALTVPFQVALWTLTTTPVSQTGAVCGFGSDTSVSLTPSVGQMMVALTPQTVDFKPGDPRYWEPFDFFEYTGSRSGPSFIARQSYPANTTACGTVTSETTVTGTFSDDGSHLTAQQVDSITVGDAHVVRIYSWSADRQCDGSSPNCLVPLP